MAIVVKLDDHLYTPIVICDYCGERIADAKDGNFEWREADSEQGATIYFTHKHCSRAFEQAAGRGLGVSWYSNELQLLPLYLGNNLELDWEEAKRLAGFVDSL